MKFNEVCVERYTGRYEFYIAPNFVAVYNHRFMRLIQNKSTLGIYHPNYLLNSVTWLVAVNFGIFL